VVEPPAHALLGQGVQIDDRAALVLDRFPAVDEIVILELAREPAGCREREAQLVRELADGALALGADVDEQAEVAGAEGRAARLQERLELRGRPPSPPEAAQHETEQATQLLHLRVATRHCFQSVNSYHPITIIKR
jgi:hypothetical protein